jgi:ribosomal protein S18 acetylase RimI-like enzyme
MVENSSGGSVEIEVTEEAHAEARRFTARRLQEFNAPYLGSHPFGTLDVYARDAAGQIVGGLIGEFAFGWLSIQVLWVDERFRGNGIGSAILKAAERRAIEKGCRFAGLDTMSFQAPAFYERRGYVSIGRADGYPGGAYKIFTRKELEPAE